MVACDMMVQECEIEVVGPVAETSETAEVKKKRGPKPGSRQRTATRRNYVLRKIPGASEADVDALIKKTNIYHVHIARVVEIWLRCQGKCELCQDRIFLTRGLQGDESGEVAHCDHDHETGKVRGMLCSRCNLMVGGYEKALRFGEKKIRAYLKLHRRLYGEKPPSQYATPSGRAAAALHEHWFGGHDGPWGSD